MALIEVYLVLHCFENAFLSLRRPFYRVLFLFALNLSVLVVLEDSQTLLNLEDWPLKVTSKYFVGRRSTSRSWAWRRRRLDEIVSTRG